MSFQIHLVDGTYELFRAFYGAPPHVTSAGREVGATVGFVRSLLPFLQGGDVTHAGCAFDHQIESFRNELFPGYKDSQGVDPLILAQFSLVEEAADVLGLAVWPMVEFEADDMLASAAARWSHCPEVERIVICSPDKDLAQCVRGDRVVCYDRRSGTLLDEKGVGERFGVKPESIPDWLSLVGDSADGIPGIRGWGKKSASQILGRYRHLEKIPTSSSDWDVQIRGARRLAEQLQSDMESVLLYRELATLRCDLETGLRVEDLKWSGIPRERFRQFCLSVERPDLMESVRRWSAAET